MFLTITATGRPGAPATDLGYLLHKHPERAQRFTTSFGDAHVFYPEADEERCTAALLLDVDPAALLRRGRGRRRPGKSPDTTLADYVNDRPYAASSLLAVALNGVFASAMRGRCRARPELPGTRLPLSIALPAVPARGGAELVHRLFAPLGWRVATAPVELDPEFPEWGTSPYVHLELGGEQRLSDALQHLYVLLPVLDGAKHYWAAPDEVDKLLRSGEGWLPVHPERELIVRRYLARRASLVREADERLEEARLAEVDDQTEDDFDEASAGFRAEPDDVDVPDGYPGMDVDAGPDGRTPAGPAPAPAASAPAAGPGTLPGGAPEAGSVPVDVPDTAGVTADGPIGAPAARVPLAVQRREAVVEAVRASGARRVLDLGCGSGQLVRELLKDHRVTEVVGVDASVRSLAAAARRLRLSRLPERQAARVSLLQGALTYTDARLTGYDAAVLQEVIEHVDEPRLPALEHAVFGAARPGTVVVTTPNAEYNVRWETLPAGAARHPDHRFEWGRDRFRAWAVHVAESFGYRQEWHPVGPDDPEVGPPSQMAVFRRGDRGDRGDGAAAGPAYPPAATRVPAPEPAGPETADPRSAGPEPVPKDADR